MWQEEAKCFREVSLRCEGPQTHLNPGGLYLIAFDVHVNMTCFNIPALTIPGSEDQGKMEGRGWGSGFSCTNWLPGLSIPPGAKGIPCPHPSTPNVFPNCPPLNTLSLLWALLRPQTSPICPCVCLHAQVHVHASHCNWHIIKGNSGEREKLNREGSVPWICSGWHPSILLCE